MEKTETVKSSTLEKEVPKHKNALAEKYEKEDKEQHQKEVDGYERLKTKESSKLPRPTGWRNCLFAWSKRMLRSQLKPWRVQHDSTSALHRL